MRFAAGVEYDGRAFAGWQVQPGARTIAGVLTAALSNVADHPVHVTCAGRTDAGVHAFGQVVHFDAAAKRSVRSWLLGGNASLPRDVSLCWVQPVARHFHARYSALERSYCYLITNRPARAALLDGRALWRREPLDVQAMNEAAQRLLGEHDFSSFRGADCTSRSAVRNLTRLVVQRDGAMVRVDVTANAFLLHMVRNLVGALVAVGGGGLPATAMTELLHARDRRLAPPMAAADGLYLARVAYDPAFGIPVPVDPL